jgi:hypothetical protein
MNIRVDLNPEMEARLISEARSQGVPLEKLAERLLKEALTASSLSHGVLTVDEFHHMPEGMAAGSEKLPNLPTKSFSRESFYEDRLDGEGCTSSMATSISGGSSQITQNVGEFWNTCTRPLDRNGYALLITAL